MWNILFGVKYEILYLGWNIGFFFILFIYSKKKKLILILFYKIIFITSNTTMTYDSEFK